MSAPEEGIDPEAVAKMLDEFSLAAGALKGLVLQVNAQGFTMEQSYQIVTDLIHAQSHYSEGDPNDRS